MNPRRYLGFSRWTVAFAVLVSASAAPAKMVVPEGGSMDGLRMIRVEVEIYEVAYRERSDLGVEWNWVPAAGRNNNLLGSFSKFPLSINEQGSVSVSVLDLKYGILTATLQAAMERGNARLLSKPTIVTRDGQTAQVASGEEIPFTVLSTIANNIPQNMVTQYRQTGVTLQVTPRILPPVANEVTGATASPQKIALQLRPAVSDIMRIDRLTLATNNIKKLYDLPVVAQRSVESLVVVRDGQTLVLGGLLEERYDERQQGVPYLKNVPVLGHAFKTTSKRSLTTEIIMYVTPHIMDPGKEFLEQAEARLAQSDAARHNAALVDHQHGAAAESDAKAVETATELAAAETPATSELVVEGARTFVETGGKTPFTGRKNKIVAVGQVHNRSSRRLGEVMIEAALYDDHGNLMDVVTKRVGQLSGGQERTFRIEFDKFDTNFNNAYIAHRVEYKTYHGD